MIGRCDKFEVVDSYYMKKYGKFMEVEYVERGI